MLSVERFPLDNWFVSFVFEVMWFLVIIIILIVEHLLRRISLTVHQSLCRFTLIDMIMDRHIKFDMLKT